MKAFFVVLMGLFAGTAAQAEVQVYKVLDGSVAYCNSKSNYSGQKVIRVELLNESATEQNQDATIKVSVVKCQDSQWVVDQLPTSESYVAPNGLKVEVTFDNYEMLLVNKKYEVLLETSLEQLNKGQAQQDYSMAIVKEKETPQDVELLIRARKTVKAENGYEYSEVIMFGGFRVRLK
ncbi:hypothetical protein [Bdellovibrio sp. HCB-162]|uniref:hypothetical protein n=1 Tax=Bdellovibrio sp. HCB-162 TaxID=3394234 RepID=UPI0039BC52D7